MPETDIEILGAVLARLVRMGADTPEEREALERAYQGIKTAMLALGAYQGIEIDIEDYLP